MPRQMVFYAALSGEIVLKSNRVRPRFQSRLLHNLFDAFRKFKASCEKPFVKEARIVSLCNSEDDYERAIKAASHTFGVHGSTIAYRLEYSDLSDLAKKVREVAAEWVRGRKFAVRAKRSGVEGFTSLDVAREVGSALYEYSAGVDLEKPDVEVFVEVRGSIAYVHKGFIPGPGGLPIGVEGRAIVLFSGGLDSPVAAWMGAKRGIEVDLLHYILASPRSVDDAKRVALRLASRWLHGYKPRLYVVDFRMVTEAIRNSARRDYGQVVLRAAMFEASGVLAEELGYQAIFTGESIGQVSSQTLHNMYALASVVQLRVPLIRPLAGLDKEEIIRLGRRIEIYEEAAKTREYCRLGEGPVTTRAKPEILKREYEKVRKLVYEAVRNYYEEDLEG